MSRASQAIFRSKALGLVDTLRLAPEEVVDLALRIAVEHSVKGGIDRDALHHRVYDALAAKAVEGGAE